MGKNFFTEEEIEILRKNRYVEYVSNQIVRFTDEFKMQVIEDRHHGKHLVDCFLDRGIDPKMLGESRFEGFRCKLNQYEREQIKKTEQEFTNKYQKPILPEDARLRTRVKQLENELAYTRQEVEFLKKLQKAIMEAEKK